MKILNTYSKYFQINMSETAFAVYVALASLTSIGVYRFLIDGLKAELMIEERSDKDVFREYLEGAPIKEKIRFALHATHYVGNKPILKLNKKIR